MHAFLKRQNGALTWNNTDKLQPKHFQIQCIALISHTTVLPGAAPTAAGSAEIVQNDFSLRPLFVLRAQIVPTIDSMLVSTKPEDFSTVKG